MGNYFPLNTGSNALDVDWFSLEMFETKHCRSYVRASNVEMALYLVLASEPIT